MENPFRYGVVVRGNDFVDRDAEINQLFREVSSGKSVVLYSKRRMGKSSLLAEVSRLYSRRLTFVKIDLYGMTERQQLLKSIADETARSALGPIKRISSELAEFARTAKLGFSVSSRGEVIVKLTGGDLQSEELDQTLDLPEKMSRHTGRRIVVVFDEFQEIVDIGGVPLLKRMRSRFQNHENVSYVFSGSKRHLLKGIFDEEQGAFFKFARPMELGPIPSPDFVRFIVSKFKSSGLEIDREVARTVLETTRGHPYYTQQVAHELFDLSSAPSVNDVAVAASMAIDHQSPAFTAIWESVRSNDQRRLLLALTERPNSRYGFDFITRHQLKNASSIQRAEKQLTLKGVVDNGVISDPMFEEWLRRLRNPHPE